MPAGSLGTEAVCVVTVPVGRVLVRGDVAVAADVAVATDVAVAVGGVAVGSTIG